MTVDWSGYSLYPVLTIGPLFDLPRSDARLNFRQAMEIKNKRQQILADLTAQNGITLERSYECILTLNLWFRDNICSEPMRDEKLLSEWYSFGKDLNLYMGDWLIDLYPWLKWALYTSGKKSLDYQAPAVTGYRVSDIKHAAFDQTIAGWGHAYLHDPEASPTPFLRQFVYSQDIDMIELESILVELLGPKSEW